MAPHTEVSPPTTTMLNASKLRDGAYVPTLTPLRAMTCNPPATPASAPLTAKAASRVRARETPRASAAHSLSRTASQARPGRRRRRFTTTATEAARTATENRNRFPSLVRSKWPRRTGRPTSAGMPDFT